MQRDNRLGVWPEVFLVIFVGWLAREQTFPGLFRRLSLCLPPHWRRWKFGVAARLDNADMERLERIARDKGRRVDLVGSDVLSLGLNIVERQIRSRGPE